MSLLHIAWFRFKPGVSSAQIERHLVACRGLAGRVPVVRDLQCGANLSDRAAGMTHGIVVTLTDYAALSDYLEHPAHVPVATALKGYRRIARDGSADLGPGVHSWLQESSKAGARHTMIVIAPYDPAWPTLFRAEAERIRGAFGNLGLRIEHVGSTSVPGLAAKPVIDIQVSVESLEPRELHGRLLTQLGYTHFPLGEFDRVYPLFKRPAWWPSTHHVHLCTTGSEQERNHLAFRDYLRRNPHAAEEYVALKRRLASAHDGLTMESQERYSLSKSEFVRSVLSRALEDRV